MSDHDDLRLSLGSYLAGALQPGARADLEAHLQHCNACREELAALSILPGLLARVRPAELGDGLLTAPDALLPGLLSRSRAIRRTTRRRLRFWRATAAAAALAAAAAGGLAVFMAPSPPEPTRPAGSSYQLRPSLTASRTAGRVTLARKPWGTELVLTLRGLPAATSCTVVVTGPRGHAETVGAWGPTPDHAARVVASTAFPPAELTGVTVETTAGRALLTAHLAP